MGGEATTTTRRGPALRQHILLAAKDAFIELGYERTSMDFVAAKASTSKRSVYAHYVTKERLFLAVVEAVRELYLERLKTPDHYAAEPLDAVTLYCGRFLQLLMWAPVLRTCRLAIAEADRLPAASTRYYDTFFTVTHQNLADYLLLRCDVPSNAAAHVARDLLSSVVYPQFTRALFAGQHLTVDVPEEADIRADVDLDEIRHALESLLVTPGLAGGSSTSLG